MVRRHHKRHPDDVVPILLMQQYLLRHSPDTCRTAVLQKHTTPSYYFANVSPGNAAAVLREPQVHAYHLVTLNDNFAGHAHAASQLRAALHALLPAVVVTDMETGHAHP